MDVLLRLMCVYRRILTENRFTVLGCASKEESRKVMLKSVLLAGLASVFLALPVQAKEWKEIRIASEGAYPPFNYMSPDGKLEGFDLDIANALCKAMEAKCTIVANDWDGMIRACRPTSSMQSSLRWPSPKSAKSRLPSPSAITRRRLRLSCRRDAI